METIIGALKELRSEFRPRSGISAGVVALESTPVVVGFCPQCRKATGVVLWQHTSSATWHFCACGHRGLWMSEDELADCRIGGTAFQIGLHMDYEAMEAEAPHP